MRFKQLKTLLWRNLILKKRGIVSTLLEILIPTFIIVLILYAVKVKNEEEYEYPVTSEINEIENPYYGRNPKFNVYLSFPSNFDNKDKFLTNFKNNQFFIKNNYITLNENMNFTSWSDDCNWDYYNYHYDDEEEEEEEEGGGGNNDTQLNNNNSFDKRNKLYKNNGFEKINKLYNKIGFDKRNKLYNNNYIKNNKKMKRYHYYYNECVKKQIKYTIFDNESDMSKHFRDNYYKMETDYSYEIDYIGIVFTSSTSYKLKFRYGDGGELYDIIKYTSYYNNRFKTVFLFQSLVDKALINTFAGTSLNTNYSISETYIERDGYYTKNTSFAIRDYIPMFMLFYFVPCVCTLLNHLVIEKESKIKESLVIIGLKKSSFWTSWAITYGSIIIISSTIVSIIMASSHVFDHLGFSVLISIMLMFGLSCCCVSFILSTLIQKAKTANTVGVMIIVIFFLRI